MIFYGDIQLIEKNEKEYLAIACDVSASIGEKEKDIIKVSNLVAGYYTAAVPLIELFCIGARPISVVNTLGVEMLPSGKKIIKGIKKAMEEGGLLTESLTGSTEDNLPTNTTSIGVTILAEVDKKNIQAYQPRKGENVYLIGLPKVGEEFLEEEIKEQKGEVITIKLIKALRSKDYVGQMVPIGSKGIGYELDLLIERSGGQLEQNEEGKIDFKHSAGPASCILLTSREALSRFELTVPINYIGKII